MNVHKNARLTPRGREQQARNQRQPPHGGAGVWAGARGDAGGGATLARASPRHSGCSQGSGSRDRCPPARSF